VPIRILPEKVASAIAAGEVVERPESVVKELLENALDADAQRIEVEVEGGGQKRIEVIDDGVGIASEEVPLAVHRYATSKLEDEDDLFSIHTLGFRGEALSSICAVARMEIVTRAAQDEAGTRLRAEGGEIGKPKSIGAPVGTRVKVRDLFYNVPARRKFLKTEATEYRRIKALLSRYAIAYPGVAFKVIQEGRQVLQTSGSGDRREVIASVYGVDVAREMLALPQNAGQDYRVSGFISPPSIHRGSRRNLTFFVNGRWVQDASLSAAVVQAYHGLLMVGRYPMAFLWVELPATAVDVNVHPAKSEIRFRDQSRVFTVVQRSVRSTLLGQAPPPSIQIEPTWQSGIETSGEASWDSFPSLTEIRPAAQSIHKQMESTAQVPLLRAVGQVGSTYLVAEGPDGLYLIDQHAAHERVLFEAMMEAYEKEAVESQHLLEAVTLEVSPEEADLITDHLEIAAELGFGVEPFGSKSFRIRSIPSILTNMDPGRALRSIIDDLEEDESGFSDEVEAKVTARVCKRAAVKSGQVLSMEEQRKLIRDLEACQVPRTCPHGRPTMVHLSVDTLARQFGRKG
jgi:DNA mismatch repair protein MutL